MTDFLLPPILWTPLRGMPEMAVLDLIAVIWFVFLVAGMSWYVDAGPRSTQSASAIMRAKRMVWMEEMSQREVRIIDSNLLSGLQHGSSFFASTALICLGGLLAMMGQAERLAEVADSMPFAHPSGPDAFRVRLVVPVAMIVFSFFKFAWAQRLFGYCAVMIGATPEIRPENEADVLSAARDAGQLNWLAARSFARGLRGLYFTLGSLAFLIGPLALIATSSMVALTIHRREFRSESRAAMLGKYRF
jgi:uncharacterized membrane protein